VSFHRVLVMALGFALGACALPHKAAAQAWNNDGLPKAAQAELHRRCGSEKDVIMVRVWLNAMPRDSRLSIRDPLVRKVALNVGNASARELSAAGQRAFLLDAAAGGRIDYAALDKRLMEIKREFRSLTFPTSVSQAIADKNQAAALYLMAAMDSARKPANQECDAIMRSYLLKQDDRLDFMPSSRWVVSKSSPYLQQKHPGTEDDFVFRGPSKECARKPVGDDFFKVKPDGRQAGRYAALGFPEVVHLSIDADPPETCSGVLLDNKWVLTAGHCAMQGSTTVDAGRINVSLNSKVAQARSRESLPVQSTVSAVYVNDAYKEAVRTNQTSSVRGASDLALMLLSTALSNPNVPAKDSQDVPVYALGTLAGYGTSTVRVTPGGAEPLLDVGWMNLSVSERLITWSADWRSGAVGTAANASCPGDSGAPIFMPVRQPNTPAVGCISEERQLVGLVSYGTAIRGTTCLMSSAGAGPRLLPNQPWICSVTGQLC
jgi:hypothetical protein